MAQSTEPFAFLTQQSAAHSYSENIKHSRTNFFVLLLAQLYCLITIETTQDAALLSNANTQKLPILETAIGIETFYIIAPAIVLIIFFHFQIHLKSFFTSMVQLARAEGRDPIALVDTYPWFITSSMTRRYAAGVENESGFSSWFEYVAGLLFGWYSTAIISIMFWARYLPVHDWGVSTYHAVLASISIAGAVFFLYASKSGLRGVRVRGWRAVPRSFAVFIAFFAPLAGLLYATNWMFEAQDAANCFEDSFDQECEALLEFRQQLGSIGFDANAALDGAEISTTPANWIPPSEPDYDRLLAVRGAALAGADLRYASARDAIFVRSDLSGSNLRLANFTGAAFHDADLSEADLFRSRFNEANFDYARFTNTKMAEADFSGASLRYATFTFAYTAEFTVEDSANVLADGADFSYARMEQCRFPNGSFRETTWTGANLSGCVFEAVDFYGSNWTDAKLNNAAFTDRTNLAGVNGSGAELAGATFDGAIGGDAVFELGYFDSATFTGGSYRGAKFPRAAMTNVTMTGVSMIDANFVKADFRDAVLTDADFRDSDMREATFFNATLNNVNMSGGVDLSGSTFREGAHSSVSFDGSDLRNAMISDLSMAQTTFVGADLRRAKLSNVDLTGAVLDGAQLAAAEISGAKLEGASLIAADLSGAQLVGARFINANLTGVTWTDASLINVILTGADLSDAVGLEQSQLARACSDGGETLPAGLSIRPCQSN